MNSEAEFEQPVDWRVVLSDPEDGAMLSLRVSATTSERAVYQAMARVSEGQVGAGRPWLRFEHCETLPDRDWEASAYRLGLMQRALRRSDAELFGRRAHYEATARLVASNIIDRGV